MNTQRTWHWSAMVLVALAIIAYAASPAWAKGGGGGHGGGGHHAGGGEHHGEHHANHHPYHPSHHHEEHHASHHDDHHADHHVAHHNHHHENWHHGNWGPDYWGGYGGYAYAPWGWGGEGGGDTYVDNSTNVTPASNEYASNESDDANDSSTDQSAANTNSAESRSDNGFPTDDWPELGVVTYAGEYGASQGQVIVSIVPGSAASKAGFVPGDVILSLNGQPVPSADDMDTVLDNAQGQFTAEVWDARTGRKSTVEGKLDANAPATTETAAFAPQQ